MRISVVSLLSGKGWNQFLENAALEMIEALDCVAI